MEAFNDKTSNLRETFADFEPEPSEAVWSGLESRLQPEPAKKGFPWMWVSAAAAIVLLFVLGFILFTPPKAPSSLSDQDVPQPEQLLPTPSIVPESKPQFAEQPQAPETPSLEIEDAGVKPQPQSFASRGNGDEQKDEPDTTQTESENVRKPLPQVAPLSLETVYFSQAELPARTMVPDVQLPATEEPVYDTDKLENGEPLIGKIVNAGNALFDLPAGYSSSTKGDTREENYHADFRLIKIKKHTTYRN